MSFPYNMRATRARLCFIGEWKTTDEPIRFEDFHRTGCSFYFSYKCGIVKKCVTASLITKNDSCRNFEQFYEKETSMFLLCI